MIKVLFAFNGTPHLGGTEAVMMNYYKNIDKSRFSVDFLFHGSESECTDNPFCKTVAETGGRCYYVTPRGKSFFKNRAELTAFFASHKYDVVHAHMDASACFLLSAAKKAGVPLLAAHSHSTDIIMNQPTGLISRIKKPVLRLAKRRTAALADLRLACTDDAGRWLFGSCPFTVINNGVDSKAFAYNAEARKKIRNEFGIGGELVVGSVGRFAQVKNHDRMLDIFKSLRKIRPDSILLLVGDGELKERIEQRAENELPEGSVIFTGNRTDTPALLSALDAYLMPSFFEGLSVSAVEAQASGLPCLLSDTIPAATDITGLVTFLPLSADNSVWAERIIAISGKKRESMSEKIKQAGYDSIDAVRRLEKEYIKALEEVKKQ